MGFTCAYNHIALIRRQAQGEMQYQQFAVKIILCSSVLAGIFVFMAKGQLVPNVELLERKEAAPAGKDGQLSSTGQGPADCLGPDGKPQNDGRSCSLFVFIQERKANAQQKCLTGICRNGTCTEIKDIDCTNES
ncbi:uncharacterized protein LOC125944019 [Dermacentor silvarum]|uniref:uncharacterized protein LOC125944019 n=1 Tax=Dermacentor silvarum TaxID=543639 RepID=UPI002101D2D4|nr:uncharacterized protein LOC125944019 [Dermacentor silvarum]